MTRQLSALSLLLVVFATLETVGADEVLRPGDQFPLEIVENPPTDKARIVGMFTVSDDGTMSLPRLKVALDASGVRQSVLLRRIEKAYREGGIFTNPVVRPHITCAVLPCEPKRFVSVGGEVKSPGDVSYRPDLTLKTALAARGGCTHLASVESIKLIRGGHVTLHNLNQVKTLPKKHDVKLRPGDRVIVPNR